MLNCYILGVEAIKPCWYIQKVRSLQSRSPKTRKPEFENCKVMHSFVHILIHICILAGENCINMPFA